MRGVSRDQGQRMVFRGRSYECTHKLHSVPNGFTSSYKFSAIVGDGAIDA